MRKEPLRETGKGLDSKGVQRGDWGEWGGGGVGNVKIAVESYNCSLVLL
jgi:hypothetical protein